MGKKVEVLVVFGLFIGMVVSHPICLGYEFPVKRTNTFCTQFNPQGCCDLIQDAEIQSNWVQMLQNTNTPLESDCAENLKNYLCAVCDPYAGHYFGGIEGLNSTRTEAIMCQDFCSTYYSSCSSTFNFTQPQKEYCTENGAGSLDQYCFPFKPDTLPPIPNQLDDAFPNLSFLKLIDLQPAPKPSTKLYAVTRDGKIYVFENDRNVKEATLFMNVADRVTDNGEMGLLGLTFHPNFETNRYFYVNYVLETSGARFSYISRFTATDELHGDDTSEYNLLKISQPWANHNGGVLFFGLDGYLYIPLGDGGSAGDPNDNAQNTHSFLGKMLRIDVDHEDSGKHYSIPSGNMFVNNSNAGLPEIWALGLRNPWRCSLDKVSNRIFCGDVGQGLWEEVSIVKAGKNYGWHVVEGNHCYQPPFNCKDEGFEKPIVEYPHLVTINYPYTGLCVIGGYVYRGAKVPQLYGAYVFADYTKPQILYVPPDGDGFGAIVRLTRRNPPFSSFAVDNNDEMYMLAWSETEPQKIYMFGSQLIPEAPDPFENPFVIAGVVIGGAIVLAGIITAIVLYVKKRRRLKKLATEGGLEMEYATLPKDATAETIVDNKQVEIGHITKQPNK